MAADTDIEELRAALAQAEARAEEARREAAAHAAIAGAAVAEVARVRAQSAAGLSVDDTTIVRELQAVRRERDAILHSTTWRVTAPVRSALGRLPPGLRHAARRVLKATYWTVTLRLSRRLATRRAPPRTQA